jgi:hypothetical protein
MSRGSCQPAGRAPGRAVAPSVRRARRQLAVGTYWPAYIYGRQPLAAGSGFARFHANFHGVHSPTHHDTLYTMVRVNASNLEPCINHATRSANPKQWSRETILNVRASRLLADNRARVLAAARERGGRGSLIQALDFKKVSIKKAEKKVPLGAIK